MATRTYYDVIRAAIADITAHGYDSQERIDFWADEIRRAAREQMLPEERIEALVAETMGATFRKQVDLGGVLRQNPGVSGYTLAQMRPELHAELGRRTAASINLIKLNRPQAIAKTEQRFRGWATSVPKGGSETVQRREEAQNVRKALAQLPFEERRVIIDQNAKLFSAINTTVAVAGGAIGAVWQSHKHQKGYDGRPTHNARDGVFFLVRGSWAQEAGLVKLGGHHYTDEVEQPAEWPFCKCSWQYIYSLRSIPTECLTKRGEEKLAEAKRKVMSHA